MPIDAVSNNIPGAAPQKSAPARASGSGKTDAKPEDSQETQKLAQRDREVRAHEAAHAAAGGQYVRGGATFQYQKGPDGKMYAVGGEVSIDCSPVKGDPRATVAKMQAIQRAAMAPADPSGQDRSVAAAAAAGAAQARQEMAQKTGTGQDSGSKVQGAGSAPKDSKFQVPDSKLENKETETAILGSKTGKEPRKSSGYNGKGEAQVASKDTQAILLNIVA
jgi:hypothetical protein